MRTLRSHILALVGTIVLCQSAGLIGAVFTQSSISTWYASLAKPALTPPGWVFGPVWTLLYTMMGIALYLVWVRHVGGRTRLLWLRVFLLHLVLNTAWSIVFFGLQALLPGLIVIGVLWCAVATLIILALRFNALAGYLLLPYLAWVSFASYLTYGVWSLNT